MSCILQAARAQAFHVALNLWAEVGGLSLDAHDSAGRVGIHPANSRKGFVQVEEAGPGLLQRVEGKGQGKLSGWFGCTERRSPAEGGRRRAVLTVVTEAEPPPVSVSHETCCAAGQRMRRQVGPHPLPGPACCRPCTCPRAASSSCSALSCLLSFCRMWLGYWEGSSTAIHPFSSSHSISSATSCFHSCPRTRGEGLTDREGEGAARASVIGV